MQLAPPVDPLEVRILLDEVLGRGHAFFFARKRNPFEFITTHEEV